MRSNPESIRPFLRLARAFMTRDESKLPSFRSLVDNAFILPDEVFNAVTPSLIKTLQNYKQVSASELSMLQDYPEALKPFLNLKSMFYLRPRHRFSEMVENAVQLPDTLLTVMSPEILRRFNKYPNEVSFREKNQLTPYLRLRHELGLTGSMLPLAELASKVVDGIDEKKFPEYSAAVLIMLAGYPKKQVGDRTLAFLGKHSPQRLRTYLLTQSRLNR